MDWHLGSSGTSPPDGDLGAAAPSGRIALFGNPSGGQPAPFPPLDNLIVGNIATVWFSISRLSLVAPGMVARCCAPA